MNFSIDIIKPLYVDRTQPVRYPKTTQKQKQIQSLPFCIKYPLQHCYQTQENLMMKTQYRKLYQDLFQKFIQNSKISWKQTLQRFYETQDQMLLQKHVSIKNQKQNRSKKMTLINQFWSKFKKDIYNKYRHKCQKSKCQLCQIQQNLIKQLANQSVQNVKGQNDKKEMMNIIRSNTNNISQNNLSDMRNDNLNLNINIDYNLNISVGLKQDNNIATKKSLKIFQIGDDNFNLKTNKSIKGDKKQKQKQKENNQGKSIKWIKNDQNNSSIPLGSSKFSHSTKKIAFLNNEKNINQIINQNQTLIANRKQNKKRTVQQQQDQNLSKIYRKDKDIYTRRKSKDKQLKKNNKLSNFHKSKSKVLKKSFQKQNENYEQNNIFPKTTTPSLNSSMSAQIKKQSNSPIIKLNKSKKEDHFEQSSQVKEMRDIINNSSKAKKKKGLVRINSKRYQSGVSQDSLNTSKSSLEVIEAHKKTIPPLSKYEKQRAFYNLVREQIPQSFYLKKRCNQNNINNQQSHIKFRKQSVQLDVKQLQNMKPSRKRSIMKKLTRFDFEKSFKDHNIDLIKIKEIQSSILDDELNQKSLKNVKQKIQSNFNETTLTNTNIQQIYKFYMYTQYQIACNLKNLEQSSIQTNKNQSKSQILSHQNQNQINSINKLISNLDIQEDDLIVNINCEVNQQQMKSVEYSIKYYSNEKIRKKVIDLIQWDKGKEKKYINQGLEIQQVSLKNIGQVNQN